MVTGEEACKETKCHYYHCAEAQDETISKKVKILEWPATALPGPTIMDAIFYNAVVLIVCLVISGTAVILGGVSAFCLAMSVYLFVNGVQQVMAAALTGTGVLWLSMLLLAGSVLFAYIAAYWERRIVPMIVAAVNTATGSLPGND